MRHIHEWQKVVHRRNVEKGFYDYKADIEVVSDVLDRAYRDGSFGGLASKDPVEVTVPLGAYWAMARLVTDYKQAVRERKLLLAIGELCEAHEELRSGHEPTEVYFSDFKPEKPEGYPVEIADAVIRLLDLTANDEIDLETVMNQKHDYNGTREHRHGRKF